MFARSPLFEGGLIAVASGNHIKREHYFWIGCFRSAPLITQGRTVPSTLSREVSRETDGLTDSRARKATTIRTPFEHQSRP